jgi:hypothetical protein
MWLAGPLQIYAQINFGIHLIAGHLVVLGGHIIHMINIVIKRIAFSENPATQTKTVEYTIRRGNLWTI